MGGFGDMGAGLGSFAGNLAVMAGGAGSGGENEMKLRVALWQKLQTPEFDPRDLSWEELQVLSQESPTLYQAIVPDEVKLAMDSPELQASQMGSLGQMEQVAREGNPLADRLAAQQARGQVEGAARQGDQSILRDLAQRGRLGGGDEIQARLGASQNAQSLASQLGNQLQLNSQNNRMNAIGQANQMAGSMRAQNFGQSQANANILNNFNQMAANFQNQTAAANAARKTTAQANNAATTQRIGETNAMGRMSTEAQNLANRNALRQNVFNNDVTKIQGTTGTLGDLANTKYAEQAARAAAIRGVASGAGQAVGGALDVGDEALKKKTGSGLFGGMF